MKEILPGKKSESFRKKDRKKERKCVKRKNKRKSIRRKDRKLLKWKKERKEEILQKEKNINFV